MGYTTKDEIKAQLDAAGIEYDSDATRDELAAMLPDEKPKGTVTMRLRRDYWTDEGERLRKGQTIDMDIDAAMDGMERGFVERVKS